MKPVYFVVKKDDEIKLMGSAPPPATFEAIKEYWDYLMGSPVEVTELTTEEYTALREIRHPPKQGNLIFGRTESEIALTQSKGVNNKLRK